MAYIFSEERSPVQCSFPKDDGWGKKKNYMSSLMENMVLRLIFIVADVIHWWRSIRKK